VTTEYLIAENIFTVNAVLFRCLANETWKTYSTSIFLYNCRYELQADHSMLEEYEFSYDDQWFKDQIQEALSFWQGAREPKFVTEEELWKCRFCKFASSCPKMASNLRC
jgi:exonuclease V